MSQYEKYVKDKVKLTVSCDRRKAHIIKDFKLYCKHFDIIYNDRAIELIEKDNELHRETIKQLKAIKK